MHRAFPLAAAFMLALPIGARAEGPASAVQISPHVGEMTTDLPAPETDATVKKVAPEPGTSGDVRDTLRFEPFDMVEDLFRNDIVLLMRHGPTDWSKLDTHDVGPTDCPNQRILSPNGAADMVKLGILLAGNDIRPAKIIVSEWCRNQQTVAQLRAGFEQIDPAYNASIAVETDANVNLLLSLQGAATVTKMREIIANWTGVGSPGPLLIISHFTNIDELTEFHVYEGELLVLDPKRQSRVLGYVRLRSAGPDVGHFAQ